MAIQIQVRRGTTAEWTSANPTLAEGEIGLDTTLDKIKIGDGVSNWSTLGYLTATADEITNQINSAIAGVIDSAPGTLDTLNELAAALNDDPNFFNTVATNLSNHESDTTNVHGISDTSLLATTSYVDTAESDAIISANSYTDSSISTHNSDTTSVHGIADTSLLATQSYADNAAAAAAAGLVDSAPETLNTLNELAAALGDDANFSTTVTNNIALKAPIESPSFTGVPTAPTATSLTNNTQIATTEFVQTVVSNAGGVQQIAYVEDTGSYTLLSGSWNDLTSITFTSTGSPVWIEFSSHLEIQDQFSSSLSNSYFGLKDGSGSAFPNSFTNLGHIRVFTQYYKSPIFFRMRVTPPSGTITLTARCYFDASSASGTIDNSIFSSPIGSGNIPGYIRIVSE